MYSSIITIIIETVTSNRLFLETGNVEKAENHKKLKSQLEYAIN